MGKQKDLSKEDQFQEGHQEVNTISLFKFRLSTHHQKNITGKPKDSREFRDQIPSTPTTPVTPTTERLKPGRKPKSALARTSVSTPGPTVSTPTFSTKSLQSMSQTELLQTVLNRIQEIESIQNRTSLKMNILQRRITAKFNPTGILNAPDGFALIEEDEDDEQEDNEVEEEDNNTTAVSTTPIPPPNPATSSLENNNNNINIESQNNISIEEEINNINNNTISNTQSQPSLVATAESEPSFPPPPPVVKLSLDQIEKLDEATEQYIDQVLDGNCDEETLLFMNLIKNYEQSKPVPQPTTENNNENNVDDNMIISESQTESIIIENSNHDDNTHNNNNLIESNGTYDSTLIF